jgi:hypothetical protein
MTNKLYLVMIIDYLVIEECVKKKKIIRRGVKRGFHLGFAIDPLLCYK